jgi:cytochrome c-type biogenesis protein CcmF
MLGTVGFVLILASFALCLTAGVAFWLSSRAQARLTPAQMEAAPTGDVARWLRAGAWSWHACSAALLVASGVLYYLLMTSAYQYAYVYQYTSNDLPLIYTFSSFWAGQEGSFLLWTLMTAGFGQALLWWGKPSWRAPVMVFTAGSMAFLISMLLGLKFGALQIGSSPFETLASRFPDAPVLQMPGFVPADGNGMNDLLQNPWMAIHPPTLFVGFSSLVIPFGFAAAALWQRRFTSWVRPALPWMLFGIMTLGVGIAMGGYWAYVTLSFGGYWAWDPVENSSLVPWLIGVAGLHAMLVQRKTSGAHKAAIVLTLLTYLFCVYSTFLTRSGILGDISVHSFVDLGLTNQLLVWIAVVGGAALALFALRYRELPSPNQEPPYLSREFMIFSGAMLLCALAAVIILGTSAPIFGRIFRDDPAGVAIAFYNRWTLPIACAFMLLVAVGQLFWWHKMTVVQLNRVLTKPLGLAVASTLAVLILTPFTERTAGGPPVQQSFQAAGFDLGVYGTSLLMLLLVLTSFFALYGNAFVMWRIGRGNWKMIGGALSHVGLALTVLGIVASSGFSTPLATAAGVAMPATGGGTSRDNFVLERGQTRELPSGYVVTYTGRETTERGFERYILDFAAPTGRSFTLNPVVYQNDDGQWIQHPDVAIFAEKDIYAAVTPSDMFSVPDSAKVGTIALAEGQSTSLGDNEFTVRFAGFDAGIVDRLDTHLVPDSAEVVLGATLEVTRTATGETRQMVPVYIVQTSGRVQYLQARARDWDLRLTFSGIDVQTGEAELAVEGVSVMPEDWIVVQAYEKPFIGVLWIGIILLSIGFCVSIYRRMQDTRVRPASV